MKLRIEIELDNVAFEDGGAEEIARIMRSVVGRLPDPLQTTGGLSLHDANGNLVGFARIMPGNVRKAGV